MTKPNKTADQRLEDEMFKLYEERGPMTDGDLLRAGYTTEQIARIGPRVAVRIRENEMA